MIVKPLGALTCRGCRDGWHMTAEGVMRCEERLIASFRGVYGRLLDDGRVIVVYRMIFNDRLCIGPAHDGVYDRAWCYPQDGSAVRAAATWDGEGVPPGPVIKEAGAG